MGIVTLAIDTATASCSVALLDGATVLAENAEHVGRGHAERLMPMVADLLAEADGAAPGAILVDCGPGSFTGVRVGLAAAIGLGLGWQVPVRGYPSLAALAAAFLAAEPGQGCGVALTGGHGELFVQRFAASGAVASPLLSLPPEHAAAAVPDAVVIGSGAAQLVAARGTGTARDRLPHAADARLLGPGFVVAARPIYGRAPDARPRAA